MHHGGQGWLDYDRLFQQQAATESNLQWSLVHPGLQATTILSHSSGLGTFCNLSQECDHTTKQCAMTQLQQPFARNNQTTMAARTMPRRICTSWNEGSCAYPGSCTCRHICTRCFQPSHPARDCQLATRARQNQEPTCPPPQHPVELSASFNMTLHFTSLCLLNWLDNRLCHAVIHCVVAVSLVCSVCACISYVNGYYYQAAIYDSLFCAWLFSSRWYHGLLVIMPQLVYHLICEV